MATFRNEKNVHLAGPVSIKPSYDDKSRTYVVEVTGKDADAFRKVADAWGYVEDDAAASADED